MTAPPLEARSLTARSLVARPLGASHIAALCVLLAGVMLTPDLAEARRHKRAAMGQRCGGPVRCMSGLVCSGATHRCVSYSGPGQQCATKPCAAGLQCVGGRCRRRGQHGPTPHPGGKVRVVGPGQPCGKWRRCGGGYVCHPHQRRCRPKFTPKVVGVGRPCGPSRVCAGGLYCHPGKRRCLRKTPKVIPTVGLGQVCGPNRRCAGGLYCHPRQRRCRRAGAVPAPAPQGRTVAWVFEHANFKGRSRGVGPGRYGIQMFQRSIGNDQLSSLRVQPGWEVVLYEHAGFQGRSRLVRGSLGFVGHGWNDKVSSMIVRRAGGARVPAGKGRFCANENGYCRFRGRARVTYGARGRFRTRVFKGRGVACNNKVFGDPVPGVVKKCWVQPF